LTISNTETGNQISIIPEMGARLNQFIVNLHGSSVDIIDGYSDPKTLEKENYAKSSLLAPFPNRIADGAYSFRGTAYQLPINRPHEHNAIHGFVSHKVFKVESSGVVDDFYEVVLRCVLEGSEGYPFSFAITVRYRFGGVWLEVDTELKNTGNHQLPAGFGWHPYFRTGNSINGLRLTLPEVEQLEVDERLIPTGKKAKFDSFAAAHPIGTTEFDTGFHLIGDGREVQLFDEMSGLYITLTLPETDTPYEYVQVYTPPHRESIALEPMTCAADAFNNGMGLKRLSPGESLRSHFAILVS
ncbi:hypothetical protein KC906_02835, partial [Candidatus Kaiserbacteria bacterium]|nr:hypothetical protein [Candidatus Kaiserbacteria bacterium]